MMATRKGFTLSYIYLWFTVCNVSENGMNRLNDIYVAGVGVVNPSASLTRLEKLPANTMKDRAYVYHFSHIYASTIINITVPHEISHVWCACVRVCVLLLYIKSVLALDCRRIIIIIIYIAIDLRKPTENEKSTDNLTVREAHENEQPKNQSSLFLKSHFLLTTSEVSSQAKGRCCTSEPQEHCGQLGSPEYGAS